MVGALINSLTSGEISDDAWDRVDIQPVNKGCEEATNFVLRIAGPLGKRRGMWDIAGVGDQTQHGRLIPFRRSIDDALMLEFGNLGVRVWRANGAPVLSGGVQVNFASPYTSAQLDGLRYKQVADVIYLRHRDGLQPRTLVRQADNSWAFHVETFPDGPWRPENLDVNLTVQVDIVSGTSEADTVLGTGAGSILVGSVVTLSTGSPVFNFGHVGASFRLRQNTGTPGVKTWSTGFRPALGDYCASAGRVYKCSTVGLGPLTSGVDQAVTTPPVQTSDVQSDGGNMWTYRHDGAGVVLITAVTDGQHATGTVVSALPMQTGIGTVCWSESAYSDLRGWPRMWPSIVEERLIEGATAGALDMLDMTETAGFDTSSETFKPGLGNGSVVDTDAIRRRVGSDGAQILWCQDCTFPIIGTASGEYIASGGLFGSPVTPATIVVRQLSDYGSEDVYPVRAHKGLFFVTRGGQAVRELEVDLQQTQTGDDLTFLAKHISERLFKQLAWIPYPDEVLWARMGDGGLAAMTDHREQQVRGWTRQQLPGGFIVEDIVTLPGPGRLETLWLIVSRQKDGATQRRIWMQSQPSDTLFLDGAAFYSGAPVTSVSGLGQYEGETVMLLADGAQYTAVVSGGAVSWGGSASVVQVGLSYKTRYRSLKVDAGALQGALNLRQRPTQVVVRLKTATAMVGAVDGITGQGGAMERVATRTPGELPGMGAKAAIEQATVTIGSSRDPRIVIEEETAYDHVIYSIKPSVAVGG